MKQRGFTLIELMVVVAIIALLAAIAYPNYRDSVRRANRAEGQALLAEAMARQERFFSNNNTYTADMTDLGFAADPAVSESGFYSVDGAACGAGLGTCVTLTASNQGGQEDDDTCETMSVDSTGLRSAADAGGNDTTNECW